MSAGCARRVMRKHILRIFCALKARIFPTFFSCSSSARKKHMACIFDFYKCLKQNRVKIPVFAAFPTSVLTSFGRGFLYKPEKLGTRLNLYLTCV